MKVVMVVPSLSRTGGGLFDSVRRLAQELSRESHVDVRAIGPSDEFTSLDAPAWEPIATRALDPWGPTLLGFTPRLGSELERQAPEIVHQHGLWTVNSLEVLRFVALRKRRMKPRPTRLVISTHGMADPWALNQSKARKSLAWHVYQRPELQNAACIVVGSATEGQSLRRKGIARPIVVIPNGVDVPRKVPGSAPWADTLGSKRRVLLFLGRFHPKKGLLPLLLAWANALASHRVLADEWSLVLTGWDDGGHQAALVALARELGLSTPHLHFTGPLFGRDRDLALRHASALTLPSLSEGIPMSVLEGMAFGLPLLISDACNLPQVFARGAGLRADPTAASLGTALRTLATLTPEQRAQMGAAGRLLATTDFSWSAVAQATHRVYTWVAQPTQPKPDLEWV